LPLFQTAFTFVCTRVRLQKHSRRQRRTRARTSSNTLRAPHFAVFCPVCTYISPSHMLSLLRVSFSVTSKRAHSVCPTAGRLFFPGDRLLASVEHARHIQHKRHSRARINTRPACVCSFLLHTALLLRTLLYCCVTRVHTTCDDERRVRSFVVVRRRRRLAFAHDERRMSLH